jgi:hypothetical protein
MGWSVESIVCGNQFLGYIYKTFGGSLDAEHCSRLQVHTVAAQLNVPGKPYVAAKSPDEILAMADEDGFVWPPSDPGSGQCVALVKAAIPALGPTQADGEPNWCKGDGIDSSNVSKFLPGTAIGYGFNSDGEYVSRARGNHVAILVSAEGGKIRILDQWQHSDDEQEAKVHEVNIGDRDWGVVTRVDSN